MAQEPQSLQNHTKFDPAFHFFLAPAAILMLIEAIWRVAHSPDWGTSVHLAGAVWAIVLVTKMRRYSLKIQDRVIRLEERVRLKELLPATLQGRIGELTEDQLIGLRFASDAELAGLTEKTVAGKWNRKQIKEAIKTWRPDHWRA